MAAHLDHNLWKSHSGIPEVFDTNYKVATSHQYPLRPEFIESTWYLYRVRICLSSYTAAILTSLPRRQETHSISTSLNVLSSTSLPGPRPNADSQVLQTCEPTSKTTGWNHLYYLK